MPEARSADLAAALGADGTFRGVPSVAGTVDTSAWTLVSDLAAGEPPRFAPAGTHVATPIGPWSALGCCSNGPGTGALNNSVLALAVSGTDLYVGGTFYNAAGIAEADYVARWDGSHWHALGSNGPGTGAIFGYVDALAVSGTNLYVGGQFDNAAGILEADNVARWDGTQWHALGNNGVGIGAINDRVYALAVSGTNLYVGGQFGNAAGLAAANYIAKWNGSAWSALGCCSNGSGGAISSTVDALAVSGTDLYVGGYFGDAAGIPEADYVAKWNGSAWSALGSNGSGNGAITCCWVNALAVSGTDLYVGGYFGNVAGIPAADYVAKWNGSAWSALGSSGPGDGALGSSVYSLAVSGSDVYVGGAYYLFKWNGSAWSAVGWDGAGDPPIFGYSYALAVSSTSLYVGGAFVNAAGIATADFVAKWALGSPRKPDGRIRLGTSALVGNNIYNTTGVNQSRTGSATPGHSVTFGISIQNDGTGADRFKVKATGTALTGYVVKYFRGTTDISAAVVAGTYQTASLAPTATYLITATVTVKSGAAVGSNVTRLVTLTSIGNSTKKDAVKFIGKRA